MQGFLRTDDENHHVVLPQHAKAYFSACSDTAAMPPGSGIFKDCSGSGGTEPAKLEGHMYLAPYAHFPARCVIGLGLCVHLDHTLHILLSWSADSSTSEQLVQPS